MLNLPPVHAGQILKDELEFMGVTPTQLARDLDVPTNRITQIIKGQRGITGDTALRLAHWFGMDAQFWLNLQNQYDTATAYQMKGKIIEKLPVSLYRKQMAAA
jgi:antitoxin HigA-1